MESAHREATYQDDAVELDLGALWTSTE